MVRHSDVDLRECNLPTPRFNRQPPNRQGDNFIFPCGPNLRGCAKSAQTGWRVKVPTLRVNSGRRENSTEVCADVRWCYRRWGVGFAECNEHGDLQRSSPNGVAVLVI